jgi:hypothetical protein
MVKVGLYYYAVYVAAAVSDRSTEYIKRNLRDLTEKKQQNL